MSTRRMGLGDYVAHEARHAIHDIRQKLLEEAWFGRVVTAEPVMEVFRDHEHDRSREASFSDLWGRTREGQEQPQLDRDPNAPDLDR